MIELTDEQVCELKQGYSVGCLFQGSVGTLSILAAQQESTESVLQETLDEIREKAALAKLGRSAAISWTKENPY